MYNLQAILGAIETDRSLPTVRIQRIIIENMKSVEYGELTAPSSTRFIKQGTGSEIIGVYGQNGSGKTTIIEALSILKYLLTGRNLPGKYTDIIRLESPKSRLEVTFDFQYDDGRQQTIIYEASLMKVVKENENANSIEQESTDYSLEVRDEKISIAGSFGSKKLNKQLLIDASSKDLPFGPANKYEIMAGGKADPDTKFKLFLSKETNRKSSSSFIFDKDTMDILCAKRKDDTFFSVLFCLAYFANGFLFVVDTRGTGIIGINAGLDLNLWLKGISGGHIVPIAFNKPNIISKTLYPDLAKHIDSMNIVLTQIIPGMSLVLNNLGPAVLKNDGEGIFFELTSNRYGTIIPLRSESDGIKKIISVLNLFIAVYNQKSTTVAIDELDAGIFEYLLGEIIQIIDKSGQGQLFFTSHNLRPLEVLDYKSIVFTTTNEKNRYMRMENVQTNNNLRDTYFRTILLGGQKEELYSEADTYEIERAFWKAGKDDES